jgi:hypothetical protein
MNNFITILVTFSIVVAFGGTVGLLLAVHIDNRIKSRSRGRG